MPVSGRIPADLLELAADIALVGVPSDDVASVILEAHPLPEVFAKLEEAETGGKEESDLCIFLERIFETTPGSELLAHAMPYAEAGLAAGSPRVRKLACAQLGRAIAFATSSEGAAPVPEKLLAVLADVLRDSDAGVAAAAATALSSLASAAPETLDLIVSRLSSFVVDHRPETRLRAHALASKLASSSLRAAAAVAERGLHDELMREVDDRRDPLAVMAAMELLAELVEADLLKPQQRLVSRTRFSQNWRPLSPVAPMVRVANILDLSACAPRWSALASPRPLLRFLASSQRQPRPPRGSGRQPS